MTRSLGQGQENVELCGREIRHGILSGIVISSVDTVYDEDEEGKVAGAVRCSWIEIAVYYKCVYVYVYRTYVSHDMPMVQ